MAWREGQIDGTWSSGSGKHKQDLIGVCKNIGPSGQRYMLRRNKFCGVFNRVCGTYYVWCDWNEDLNSPIINLESGSESDWTSCWQQGFMDIQDLFPEEPVPDPIPDPTTSNQNFSSISNIDWRIALAIGIGVITLVYAIIVLRKK